MENKTICNYSENFKGDLLRVLENYSPMTPQHNAACALLREIIGKCALDELENLILNGPVNDGDLISKKGRDILLIHKLAVKVIVKGNWGYQCATYLGRYVWGDIK